jgi:hypothetical protein
LDLEPKEPNPLAGRDGDDTLERLKAARRASGPVFGDTPIQMPPPVSKRPPEEDEAEESASLEPRVRNAAVAAALKTVALACCAGALMGIVLFCSLSSLMGGSWSVFLGLIVAAIAVPVAIVAGFSAFRQTLETERHKVGLCPRCGYDLRGSMGTRCPECGTRITAPGSTRVAMTDEEQQRENLM